jgi:hypothetical protein
MVTAPQFYVYIYIACLVTIWNARLSLMNVEAAESYLEQ